MTQSAEHAEYGGLPSEWFRELWVGHIRLPTVGLGCMRYTGEEAVACWATAMEGGASA